MAERRPRKVGRPPLLQNQARNAQVMLRLRVEEKERFEGKARANSLTLSEWIRRVLNAAVDS